MRIPIAVMFVSLMALSPGRTATRGATTEVTRATLDNGLRVVIVHNPLAPVATVEENYLAGANETREGFPGTAHAQEHMAFRGCAGLTADQIAAICRFTRTLETALLPKLDPVLRETTPQTVSSIALDDVKAYYAQTFRPDLTTIV